SRTGLHDSRNILGDGCWCHNFRLFLNQFWRGCTTGADSRTEPVLGAACSTCFGAALTGAAGGGGGGAICNVLIRSNRPSFSGIPIWTMISTATNTACSASAAPKALKFLCCVCGMVSGSCSNIIKFRRGAYDTAL